MPQFTWYFGAALGGVYFKGVRWGAAVFLGGCDPAGLLGWLFLDAKGVSDLNWRTTGICWPIIEVRGGGNEVFKRMCLYIGR